MKSIFDEDTYDIRDERGDYSPKGFLTALVMFLLLVALMAVIGTGELNNLIEMSK